MSTRGHVLSLVPLGGRSGRSSLPAEVNQSRATRRVLVTAQDQGHISPSESELTPRLIRLPVAIRDPQRPLHPLRDGPCHSDAGHRDDMDNHRTELRPAAIRPADLRFPRRSRWVLSFLDDEGSRGRGGVDDGRWPCRHPATDHPRHVRVLLRRRDHSDQAGRRQRR